MGNKTKLPAIYVHICIKMNMSLDCILICKNVLYWVSSDPTFRVEHHVTACVHVYVCMWACVYVCVLGLKRILKYLFFHYSVTKLGNQLFSSAICRGVYQTNHTTFNNSNLLDIIISKATCTYLSKLVVVTQLIYTNVVLLENTVIILIQIAI